jgi:3-phenylpropionate/trans-cinnamate dioxygenase ferredoxin reductase component
MTDDAGVAVIGASVAGLAVASRLCELGYDQRVAVLGDEAHAPYQRPPLSKAMLGGHLARGALDLPAPHPDVQVTLGVRAVSLDRERRTVSLHTGAQVRYQSLVIATGSRPRRLTGPDVSECVLQTVDDCLLLREQLRGRPSLLVVGAGFLGMEIASTCLPFTTSVTVVDLQPPLLRQVGGYLSGLLAGAARDSGVKAHVVPGGIEPAVAGRRLVGVRLPDGRTLTADLVVTAVGAVPNTEWLDGSGLPASDGIEVDQHCRAADGIYAVGDVASSLDPQSGVRRRSPQWTSPREQGRIAAESIMGTTDDSAADAAPYFWTEQFGCSVKVSGPLPVQGEPELVDGCLPGGPALLHWPDDRGGGTAVALNHKITVGRLARVARTGSLTGPGRRPSSRPSASRAISISTGAGNAD